MTETRNSRTGDLQASVPEIQLGLTRAGVTGVQKAIRIRHDGHEKTFAAEISCTVDLDPGQKGVHMSRFPELFGEAIDQVVIGEAFLVETLAEHIAAPHRATASARCGPRCGSRRSTRSSARRRSPGSRPRRSRS